jgi:parallel beta-helix repeat protein
MNLVNQNNMVIENKIFTDPTVIGISLSNCTNITIQHCTFINSKKGIYAYKCKNIIVQNCSFENINSQGVNYGFTGGHSVQFNGCLGGCIRRCVIDCKSGFPCDSINMYKSSGSAVSPIDISYNFIRGGKNNNTSGSGIMLGNGGGSYQTARYNIVLYTGNCGIGVSGGSNIIVDGNSIFMKPYSGVADSLQHLGLYVWNQASVGGVPQPSDGITISHNTSSSDKQGFWSNSSDITNLVVQDNFWNVFYGGATPDPIPTGWGA